MYKNLSIVSLLLCLCFSQAAYTEATNSDEPQLLGEVISEQCEDIPFLEDLSISGNITFAYIDSCQRLDIDKPAGIMDGTIRIDYKKPLDRFGVGFYIENKVLSGLIKQGSAIVDTSYVFIETDKLGEIRLGYSSSAGNIFSISYANVLTGYNLVDSGNLGTFFAESSGAITGTGFDKDDSKALKIVWLSPTIKGWSIGLSYAPNSRDGHLFKEKRNKIEKDYHPAQNYADKTSYIKNSFTGGISYQHGAENDFNYKIAVAGWTATGKADFTRLRHVSGYNIGAIVGYKDFKLGLGFTDNGTSMLPEEWVDQDTSTTGMCAGANAGKIYNVGISYNMGKLEMSAGYFHAIKKWSKTETAISNIATLALQYNLDRVVSAFIEYNNIRTKTCDRIYDSEIIADGIANKNNRANLFILGAKINL